MSETTTCTVVGCDLPTHDGWYVCQKCGDDLAERLTDLAWMLDQLDIVVSLQARYSIGAGKIKGEGESRLPLNIKAAEQRAFLVLAIVNAAREVIDVRPEWRNDPYWVAVDDTSRPMPSPSACAAWLEHRIAGLRLHPLGGQARDDIMRHWVACEWLIDRPPEKRFIGDCRVDWEGNPCGGRIYQRGGKNEARCDTCSGEYGEMEVEIMRGIMLQKLDDHTATAADIAHLSGYLKLTIGKVAVRKKVNWWHHKKRLIPTGERNGEPIFRFLEARLMLEREYSREDDTAKSA